jgi:Eukaryotic aspartyl protease
MLKSFNYIEKAIIGIGLGPEQQLSIGDYNHSYDIIWASASQHKKWAISIEAIYVTINKIANLGDAIIDINTNVITAPYKDGMKMLGYVTDGTNCSINFIFSTAYCILSDQDYMIFPNITFLLANNKGIELTMVDYINILPITDRKYLIQFSIRLSTASKQWVIGPSILKHIYTVLDYENELVGISFGLIQKEASIKLWKLLLIILIPSFALITGGGILLWKKIKSKKKSQLKFDENEEFITFSENSKIKQMNN